ncbi:nitrate reductase gamma subunit [Chloroflexota bacterium]
MLLHLIFYAALLSFVILFILKTIKYATAPIHLRWELYPVAHEVGHKSGGSYLEELNWWTKPRRKSLLGEIKYMAREGLLFEKCFRHNRGLWYFTHPFHIGLFLLTIWLILLFAGALTMLFGIPVAAPTNAWVGILYYLTLVTGIAGLVLGTFGCTGLLVRRLTNEDLKAYTAPIDYFNLILTLAILLGGMFSWIFFDPTFTAARELTRGFITYNPVAVINPAMTVTTILFSLFLVYLPSSRMMHGLAKYFTYHRVLWEDEPNMKGSAIEKKVKELLEQPVSWSAPHIQSGRKWSEVAANKVISRGK